MIVTDTHCHLYWRSFDEDRSEVLARARAAGVQRMVVVWTEVETSQSAAELAEAPCFVLDALDAGEPVLDDAAKPFREHYACYKRNPTDPANTDIIRIHDAERGHYRTGKTARQYFGEFYPTSGFGKWNPGFLPKDPPRTSYA